VIELSILFLSFLLFYASLDPHSGRFDGLGSPSSTEYPSLSSLQSQSLVAASSPQASPASATQQILFIFFIRKILPNFRFLS